MTFQRIASTWCAILMFFYLGDCFNLMRRRYDIFLNPGCLDDSDEDGSGCCESKCSDYKAECLQLKNCTYCVCKTHSKNTYIGSDSNGSCVSDAEIVPESDPQSFRLQNHKYKLCAVPDGLNLKSKECRLSSEMNWKWTTGNRLMNIKTLKCIEVLSSAKAVALKPCDFNSPEQKITCRRQRDSTFELKTKRLNLAIMEDKLTIGVGLHSERWTNYPNSSGPLCRKASEYSGCYRFYGGSFLRYFSLDQCPNNSCSSDIISAPIFVQNKYCTIEWDKSLFMREEYDWERVNRRNTFFSVKKARGSIGKLKLMILSRDAFNVWNGSLVKLQISCKGRHNGKSSVERHCVLLKFATLHQESEVNSTDGDGWYFSEVPTTSFKTNNSAAPSLQSRITKKPNSEKSTGPKLIMIIAISSAVAVCLALLLLIYVLCRRRKRNQASRTNSTETQGCDASNLKRDRYEEPASYAALRIRLSWVGDEHAYQGLVTTTENGNDLQPNGAPTDVHYVDVQNGPESIYVEPSQHYQPLERNEQHSTPDHVYQGLLTTQETVAQPNSGLNKSSKSTQIVRT